MSKRQPRGAERRRHFFARGAEALAALGVDARGGYACPLCFRVFPTEALDAKVLTLEHVPPRRLGGREITLTCAKCNSTAGAATDAAMHLRRLVEDFWLGHGGELLMKMKANEHEVSVKVQRRGADNSLLLMGRPKHTHPMAHAGWVQYLETKFGRSDAKWSLTFRWYDSWLAAVGDLRVAYLAAFAKLGYSYVRSPALKVVRAQLEKPRERILPLGHFTQANAVPEAKTLAVSDTPIPCLWVQLGRQLTILPWPPSGVDPYQAIRTQFADGQAVSFEGDLFDWPTGMELILDARRERGGGHSLAPPLAPRG